MLDEVEALQRFMARVPRRDRVDRFTALIKSKKGKAKFLAGLFHDFQNALTPDLQRDTDFEKAWNLPCYVYSAGSEFGTKAPSISEAYNKLATRDGWIIVSQDGTYGVYRPEANWDGEVTVRI